MSQFRENLRTDGKTDGSIDGRTNGQTLFYRTPLVKTGSPKKKNNFVNDVRETFGNLKVNWVAKRKYSLRDKT